MALGIFNDNAVILRSKAAWKYYWNRIAGYQKDKESIITGIKTQIQWHALNLCIINIVFQYHFFFFFEVFL